MPTIEPVMKLAKNEINNASNGVLSLNGALIDNSVIEELEDCANRMRITCIDITNAAKSGHPTSSCSAAEIISTLFFKEMHYDPIRPRDENSDRFVLSKGHACPILYAAWLETGYLTKNDVMQLRKIDSDIEGHPTPRLDFIDVATGSLGQGLSCAAGMAYVGKYFDKASYRVYCLIGDGESAEGSIWEAAAFCSQYKLDNLVAIFDINRLGQSQATSLGHDLDTYKRRLEAFGFYTFLVDGHSIPALLDAFQCAKSVMNQPVAIVAKTFKGRGIVNIENEDNWHGKPVPVSTVKPIEKLIRNKGVIKIRPSKPVMDAPEIDLGLGHIRLSDPPAYKIGEMVATRVAYGTALVKLGRTNDRIVALDGDVKNSTNSDKFLKTFPDRFVECFIAEQNMIGVAVGMGTRKRVIPFVSTFAAFFTRACDQLRMGAVSFANIKCVGSHVGVSIGEDGPSQMALEDLAMFRALPGSTVFYPSDAVSCERAVELAANVDGIVFIRTGRPACEVVYSNDEQFHIGQAKVKFHSEDDRILLIGAGVTFYEALKAAKTLAQQNIHAVVVDIFCVKPIDEKTLKEQARRVGGSVLTVEDHYPQGGLCEAVQSVFASDSSVQVHSMSVTNLPRSGPPDELLNMFGISAKSIIENVKRIVSK